MSARFIALWIAAALAVSTLPGQPAPILSLTFQGNESIDAARLKERLRVSREGNWYSPQALKYELQEVERFYQDSGFLRARVGPPKIDYRSAEGRGPGVVVQVPVEEGPLYKLGQVTIKDAKVISPETLLLLAPINAGQPYSRVKLNEWLGRIRLSYHEIGHIRFEFKMHEAAHESDRTVDCVLEFAEGSPYRVGKIRVTNDAVDLVDFKKRLLVSEDGLYNPEMLAYSIQYLNLKRRYRPFSPSDVEIRIDDMAKTVDLVFHVVPLKRPSSSRQERSKPQRIAGEAQ